MSNCRSTKRNTDYARICIDGIGRFCYNCGGFRTIQYRVVCNTIAATEGMSLEYINNYVIVAILSDSGFSAGGRSDSRPAA